MPKCTCGKRASFNVLSAKVGRFCASHKEVDMVNIVKKRCEIDNCGKVPIYNVNGINKGRFCLEHKTPEMVDVINKKCELCDKQPTYNICGEKKGRFCLEHKTPEMVDVINKKCELCDKQPVYNIHGETRGRFCRDHKESNMVDVISKKCELCDKKPVYNVIGETVGRFCNEHKDSNMVNIRSTKCEICEKIPIYNIIGETRGRFCNQHKTPEMVNVVDKTCEYDGCKIQPMYNTHGETTGRFCESHKEPQMVDVKNKRCEVDGCYTRAWYGLLGKGDSHCAVHKKKGMIRYPNRKCSCKQLGTYEANGTRFCEEHKPANAENLGIATCSMCGLDDILTNGKCGTCDPQIIQTRRHAKENRVKDLLAVAGITCVHDKMLEGTMCGRERPDFQMDCGSHFVYLEVDEHQHQSYACECEQTRMVNLVEVRGMPVRWIRYNPDTYESQKGQRQVKIEQREKKLLEYVKWAMQHSPQEEGDISSVLYLFYDEYDTTNQEWQTLI